MTGIEIVEVPVPASVGGPGWDDFVVASDIDDAVQVAGYGTTDVTTRAEERLPIWQDPNEDGRILLARIGGEPVGRASIRWTLEAAHTAFVDVGVLPAQQGRGIGTVLADRVDVIARELGQSKLIVYAVSADGPGERLASPTGFGSVPRDNREVRFLLRRGWRLEQVERGSRYVLPPDPEVLDRLRAEAEGHAAGYRLHTWTASTPEPFRAGMAELMERMTTDAPSAGLEEPPETWDAARVMEYDARIEEAPSTTLTTAAEHLGSGRLSGMTRLRVPDDVERPVQQWDTIVRREDRGHRLGMLLKVANLRALQDRMPGHPSVLTWNAEENRPMLGVNEAIGFTPIGYEGAWRRDLT